MFSLRRFILLEIICAITILSTAIFATIMFFRYKANVDKTYTQMLIADEICNLVMEEIRSDIRPVPLKYQDITPSVNIPDILNNARCSITISHIHPKVIKVNLYLEWYPGKTKRHISREFLMFRGRE